MDALHSLNDEMLAGILDLADDEAEPEIEATAAPTALAPAEDPPSHRTTRTPRTYLDLTWHPRMVFDIALGLDTTEEILERYDVGAQEYEQLCAHPEFRRELAAQMADIKQNGAGFRAKAKVQAEMYLAEVHRIVTDPETPTTVQMDAIKNVVKWADLEPKDKSKDGDKTGAQFNIQINF